MQHYLDVSQTRSEAISQYGYKKVSCDPDDSNGFSYEGNPEGNETLRVCKKGEGLSVDVDEPKLNFYKYVLYWGNVSIACIQDCNKKSGEHFTEAIFQDDDEMQYNLEKYPHNETLEGKLSVYYVHSSAVNNTDLDSILTINQKHTLKKWNETLYDILVLIILLLVFSSLLIFLALFVAWMISFYIKKTVTNPISGITKYLRGEKDLPGEERHNKEVNNIVYLLKMLSIAEKFIDPNFLLNPQRNFRMRNLEEAEKFFSETSNSRGQSLIKNLIGNIHFCNKDYEKAIEEYQEALSAVEELKEEVCEQEQQEKDLSENEKAKLRENIDREIANWSREKEFLEESTAERLQQLAMAKQAYLDSFGYLSLGINKLKTLKEIKNHQVKALQYYLSKRKSLAKVVNLMIQIVYSLEQLQYYYHAKTLVDLVSETIAKTYQKPNVDIDISQLIHAGIEVKECEELENQLFPVEDTIQLEVLFQKLLYRKAMLYKSRGNFKKAARYFLDSIEYVGFHDIQVTKSSVSELYEIMRRFNLRRDDRVSSLLGCNDYLHEEKPSVVFVLGFKFEMDDSFAKVLLNQILGFVEDNINDKEVKFGASTILCEKKVIMHAWERSNAKADLQRMLDYVALKGSKPKHIYDVMLSSLDLFEESSESYMVVFYNWEEETSAAKVEDLDLITDSGVELIHVPVSRFTDLELEDKLHQLRAKVLMPDTDYDLTSVFESLKQQLNLT